MLEALRHPARAGYSCTLQALRLAARRSLRRSPPGSVTVVTATWNTLKYLPTCVEMVARHSPHVAHLVIDNHSTDGSADWARAHRGAFRYLRLPRNVGHAWALDLGFLLARSEFVIALDVDAFPLQPGWTRPLIQPLEKGAKLAGGTIPNAAISFPYVHPCVLAMRRADFVRDGCTFFPENIDSDVGSSMSTRYAEALHLIPVAHAKGPGAVGSVFGDFVYHNWGATRPGLYDTGVEAWAEALERYVNV